MKTIIQLIIPLVTILQPTIGNSQFIFGPGNLYGHTTTAMQKIGIGNFPANTDVLAKLHVNHFRLNTNAPTNGILFRTDGDQGMENRWQLFTGTSATAQTERFRLWTEAGTVPWVNQTADNSFGFRLHTPSTFTNSTPLIRMQINGYRNSLINGYTINSSGYTLLTNTNTFLTTAGAPQTPYSLLHLAGNGDNTQTSGYRPWMQTGITFTSNSDGTYIGQRQIGAGSDVTETVVCWSDNIGGAVGPDVLSFRFSAGDGTATGNVADLQGSDSDGREMLRILPNGNVGIGPKFGSTLANGPQSDLHIHAENNPISNAGVELPLTRATFQMTLDGVTGLTPTDGFMIANEEFGSNTFQNGTVLFNQNENRSMRFQSAHNITNNTFSLGERIRIASLSDTITANPGSLPRATTRVSISTRGDNPLSKPLSTLHIGENMGATNNGWRPWMNTGTLYSKADKHCYVGIRPADSDTVNTNAVVSWGRGSYVDGSSPLMPLRFIFTSENTNGPNYNPANSNGREIARMHSNGHVGIGTQQPGARLDVNYACPDSTTAQFGIRSRIQGGLLTNTAGYFETTAGATTGQLITYGMHARSQGSPDKNVGGYFEALNIPNSTNSTGVYGTATSIGVNATQIGTRGDAANGMENVGVLGKCLAANSFYNLGIGVLGIAETNYNFGSTGTKELFGVRGTANNNNGLCGYSAVGVYGSVNSPSNACTGPVYAGYFAGNVYVAGSVTAASYSIISDENLKSDVQELTDALEIVSSLKPVTYHYRTEEYPQLNLDHGLKHGFLAQQAEEVIPGISSEITSIPLRDENNEIIGESVTFKAMNYNELHAIEVAAIKELRQQITELKEQLNACCSAVDTRSTPASADHSQQVTLRDQQGIILNQNVPNPFAEQTTITYRIDEPFQKAQILFYDGSGKLIQTADITTTGSGSITVFADDLSSGTYSYALVVDGRLVDTKRMVKR